MTTKGIQKIVHPFLDGRAQPDSPHDGNLESELAAQTQALAYRCSGNTRSWTWLKPMPLSGWGSTSDAPLAEVTALSTWTGFYVGRLQSIGEPYCDFALPWLLTPSFDWILCFAQLAVETKVRLSFRIRCSTLLDACSSDNGVLTMHGSLMARPSSMIGWQLSGSGSFGVQTWSSWLAVTTPPANRRILITPEVSIDDSYGPQFDVSGMIPVRLLSIHLLDSLEHNGGAW